MTQPTLRELIEQRDALSAQIAEIHAEMRTAALADVVAKINEFEFSTYELGLVKTQHIVKRGRKESGTFAPKARPNRIPPLYRDPATGATWSGRGRTPRWMEGDRDAYLIRDNKD